MLFDEENHYWDMETFTNGEFERTNGTAGTPVNQIQYRLGENIIYMLEGIVPMGHWMEYEV